MSYSKLHSSLVNSSLWTEPDNVRILFITLLAMCDRHGVVYGSRGGIERLANIDPDSELDPWEVLMSPDRDSSDKFRNPENEGRRIEEISGGFRLLNFEYYRGLRNDDDRREQNRQAQARYKAKVSHGKPRKATESLVKPPLSVSVSVSESVSEEKKRPSTKEETVQYLVSIGLTSVDGEWLWDKWEGNGFTNNGKKMANWKATARQWKSMGSIFPSQKQSNGTRSAPRPLSFDERKKEIQRLKDRKNQIFREAGGDAYSGKRASYTPEQETERAEIVKKLEQLEAV